MALPIDQREAVTRALGVERRVNDDTRHRQRNEIDRLMEWMWTRRPLLSQDAALLREAIATAEPLLLTLVDNLGASPLTDNQRNALRGAVADNLVATGFGPDWSPNARGIRLEALIDYLAHV